MKPERSGSKRAEIGGTTHAYVALGEVVAHAVRASLFWPLRSAPVRERGRLSCKSFSFGQGRVDYTRSSSNKKEEMEEEAPPSRLYPGGRVQVRRRAHFLPVVGKPKRFALVSALVAEPATAVWAVVARLPKLTPRKDGRLPTFTRFENSVDKRLGKVFTKVLASAAIRSA